MEHADRVSRRAAVFRQRHPNDIPLCRVKPDSSVTSRMDGTLGVPDAGRATAGSRSNATLARSDERSAFVLELGQALHQHGAPAHRLERALEEVARALGLDGSFFATPTALISSFRTSGEDAHGERVERSHLRRLPPSDVSLRNLAALDGLAQRVIQGDHDVSQATLEIERLQLRPALYPAWLRIVAFALASVSAARMFGGGLNEVSAALVFGGVVGLLSVIGPTRPRLARLWPPLGAALIAFGSSSLACCWPLSGSIVVVAAIIVLLPGLTLTVGVTELAQGSLVSGTSRLAGAVLSLVLLVFGAALGSRAAVAIGWAGAEAAPHELPLWTLLLAVATALVAFMVILEAKVNDLPWMLASGLLTWSAATLCGPLGVEIAAFVGAAVAGATSNLYARALHRPAMITRVTSVLVLVPGALGFRGLEMLVRDETLRAVDTAFDVALILVAILVGLLLANSLVTPRQRL